jgi:hypothetical protein
LRPKRPNVARNHRARGIGTRSWPGVPRKALRAIHPPPTSASSAPATEPTTGNGPEISGAWNAVPESSYGVVQEGEDELHPFAPAYTGIAS